MVYTLAQILDLVAALKPGEALPTQFRSGNVSLDLDPSVLRDSLNAEVSERNEEAKKWRKQYQEKSDAFKDVETRIDSLKELVGATDGDVSTALNKALEATKAALGKDSEISDLKAKLAAIETEKSEVATKLTTAEKIATELTTKFDATATELTTLKTQSAELSEKLMLNEAIATGVRPSVLKLLWGQLKAAGDDPKSLTVADVETGEGDAKKTEKQLFLVTGSGDAAKREPLKAIVDRDYSDLADALYLPAVPNQIDAPPEGKKTQLPTGGIRKGPTETEASAAINSILKARSVQAATLET